MVAVALARPVTAKRYHPFDKTDATADVNVPLPTTPLAVKPVAVFTLAKKPLVGAALSSIRNLMLVLTLWYILTTVAV